MKKKTIQRIVWIVGIAITVLLIGWLIVSCMVKCDFLHVSLAQWIPIFLTFEVAFFLSYIMIEKMHYYDNKTKAYESILIGMQEAISNLPILLRDEELNIPGNVVPVYLQQNLLLYFKRAGGLLELLLSNSESADITSELRVIEGIFEEYKMQVTENPTSYDFTKQYRSAAHRFSVSIETKLQGIRIRLYN